MTTIDEDVAALAKARAAKDTEAVIAITEEIHRKQAASPLGMDFRRPQLTEAKVRPMAPEEFAARKGETFSAPEVAQLGAGHTLNRMYQGLLPSSDALLASILPTQASPQEMQYQKQAFGKASDQHPVAAAIGESAPYLGTMSPFVQALMAASEYGTPAERAVHAGATYGFGKLGQGLATAFGRALRPVRPANQVVSDAVENIAARERVPISAAQLNAAGASGPTPLEKFDRIAALTPGSSGIIQAEKEAQNAAFNSTVNRTMGRNGESFLGDSVENLYLNGNQISTGIANEIGTRMRQAAQGVQVDLRPWTVQRDLQQVLTTYQQRLTPDQRAIVEGYINSIPIQRVNADQYIRWRSDIGARAASTSDSDTKAALKGIQRVLDAQFDAAATPAQRAAVAAERRNFENAMTWKPEIEKASMTHGNIDPSKLSGRVIAEENKNAISRDIATLGAAIDKAPAQVAMGPVATAMMIPFMYPATRAVHSNLGRRYFSHGILPISPEVSRYMTRAGGWAGGGAAGGLGPPTALQTPEWAWPGWLPKPKE